uniref:Endonuclease/exonuclease/phosphatase domain-containing protein n=1 Tax=Haplochromis burtoni TaxID=8153 RepID=A0A3Q2WTH5_HAPBU
RSRVSHNSGHCKLCGFTLLIIRRNLDSQVLKHYTDQEGRWVVLDACLQGQKVILVNIYAPNSPQPQFFHEVCKTVWNIGNTNIVSGGDFNQVRDVFLDKSSRPRPSKDPVKCCCRRCVRETEPGGYMETSSSSRKRLYFLFASSSSLNLLSGVSPSGESNRWFLQW